MNRRTQRAGRLTNAIVDSRGAPAGRVPDEEELEAALRAAGVKTGTQVEIGDEVLEWE